jgi:hypothetical protein
MLSVIKHSLIFLSTIILSYVMHIMLSIVLSAIMHCVLTLGTIILSDIILSVIILSDIMLSDESHYALWQAECSYTDSHLANCQHPESC